MSEFSAEEQAELDAIRAFAEDAAIAALADLWEEDTSDVDLYGGDNVSLYYYDE